MRYSDTVKWVPTAAVIAAMLIATEGAVGEPGDTGGVERATAEFARAHPGARFVDDGIAGRWYIVHGFSTAKLVGDPALGVDDFVAEQRHLIGLGHPSSAVEPIRVVPHRDHRFHQLRQTVEGRPVFNAEVVVQVDGNGRIVKVSSKAVPEPSPLVEAPIGEARAIAAARSGVRGMGAARSVILGYFPLGDSARAVYRVVAPAPGIHVWETFVDALSGAVVLRRDLIRRHEAHVFEENPVVDEELTTQVFLPNIEPGEHEEHTYGSLARVATCLSVASDGDCLDWVYLANADDDDGFLDELPLLDTPTADGDGFAETNVYYHLDRQAAWVRDEFGFDGLFVDLETALEAPHIRAFVNIDMDGAVFSSIEAGSGDLILFGKGSVLDEVVDYSYDANVILHEFGHAVASRAFTLNDGAVDGLGLDLTGRAANESNSDYMAASRAGNPLHAEYALGHLHRNLENDNTCPDDLVGECHLDGLITSGALWEIREALGAKKTDHLQYGALVGQVIWKFSDYAAALEVQAEQMLSETGELQLSEDEVALIEAVISERGIDSYERLVSLWEDGGPLTKHQYCLADVIGPPGTPSELQFVAPTDEQTAVLKLMITPFGTSAYDVLMRKGEPVYFEWSASGSSFAWEATFDRKWPGSASTLVTEAKISNATEPELEPGADYFFSIVCRPTTGNGCANAVTMSLSDEPEDEPDPQDAGIDPDAGADAGSAGGGEEDCGCRVSGSSIPASTLLALVLDVL